MLSELKKAWTESGKQAKESRERDKAIRKDKKRRENFPGKYSPQLYRIFWDNFIYNWKDYVLLFICGAIMSCVTFTLLGSYQAMTKLHSDEGSLILFGKVEEGLQRIIVNAVLPLGICILFLVIYVLIFYLKKRILSYSMLVTLGIRKKLLYLFIISELGIGIIISILLGFLLGNVIMVFIYQGISALMNDNIIFSSITGSIYIKSLIIILLTYVSSFVGLVLMSDFNPIIASNRKVQSEKLPGKNLNIFIFLGFFLIIGSWVLYTKIWNFERISLIGIYCLGVFLVLRYLGAFYLRKERQGKHYLTKLLDRNQLYHRSSTTVWYLTGLVVIHLCAVFYFTFPAISVAIAEEPESLFPYEFMCMADDEDDIFFQELEEQYGAEIIAYPMVRVLTGDRTQKKESRLGYWPQGQNIGISETTYHALKQALDPDYQKQSLGLDQKGKYVYIVHQQDCSIRAHPIDWANFKIKPYIHIGLPCKKFNANSMTLVTDFPQRKIIGEEIGSLTGCYLQGLQENLIVFSDEYFAKAQDFWMDTFISDGSSITAYNEKYAAAGKEIEATPGVNVLQGPTKLVLIKADSENVAGITKELEKLEKEHYDDFELSYDPDINCWYSSENMIQDIKSERFMKLIVNLFIIIVLAVTGMIFLLIKTISEVEEKKERSVFLKQMGMRRKERIYLLKKELYIFFQIPFVIATIGTVSFTAATFYVRMYTFEVIKQYLIRSILIWAIYFFVQWIFIWILGKFVIRKAEGKYE